MTMQGSLFNQGVTLMLAGMGTVFVFLTVLVIAMSLMSTVLSRRGRGDGGGIDDDEIAAISAAIAKHRHDR